MSRPPTAAQVEARQRIQWLHRDAGISIAELARRLSTQAAVVSRWVNEHQYPSRLSCAAIERIYQDEVSRR